MSERTDPEKEAYCDGYQEGMKDGIQAERDGVTYNEERISSESKMPQTVLGLIKWINEEFYPKWVELQKATIWLDAYLESQDLLKEGGASDES